MFQQILIENLLKHNSHTTYCTYVFADAKTCPGRVTPIKVRKRHKIHVEDDGMYYLPVERCVRVSDTSRNGKLGYVCGFFLQCRSVRLFVCAEKFLSDYLTHLDKLFFPE